MLQRLLEGRINQLKGTVTITKCAHRTFAAAQWRELRDQLAAWKVLNGTCMELACCGVSVQLPGNGLHAWLWNICAFAC